MEPGTVVATKTSALAGSTDKPLTALPANGLAARSVHVVPPSIDLSKPAPTNDVSLLGSPVPGTSCELPSTVKGARLNTKPSVFVKDKEGIKQNKPLVGAELAS